MSDREQFEALLNHASMQDCGTEDCTLSVRHWIQVGRHLVRYYESHPKRASHFGFAFVREQIEKAAGKK